ncbi:MAG: insulinase family protein [Candidatus Riflebacteria bacterium]|nr:insulinase family protein [Candidatus Riflebacteria bacterium]
MCKCFLLMFMMIAAVSAADVTSGVSGGVSGDEPAFSWDPVVIEKLSNGMTIVIKEDHTTPLAVTDVWFRTGSRNESDRTNGIAHFLEHTMFKGTKTRGVGQVARDIEAFGGRTNAGTSLDYTHYYISCESRHIEKALDIFADVFMNSAFDQSAIDNERPVIIEEIKRAADDPGHLLWETLFHTIYTNHPYRRPTLGPKENIATGPSSPNASTGGAPGVATSCTGISRDDMVSFFKTWYGPENMTLIVVGDVDPKAILAKVKTLYSGHVGAAVPVAKFDRDPEMKSPRIVRRHLDVAREYLLMAYRTVPASADEESVGLDLLGIVLGQGRSSRLSMALKENRGIVTSIGAGQQGLIDDGLFMVRSEFDPIDEEEVIKGIREEIRRIVHEPVSSEELQKAKDYLETLYIRGAESVEGKAETLGSAIVMSRLNAEKNYLKNMRAVTSSQIQVLANKFLSQEGYAMVLVSPRAKYVEKGDSNGTKKYELENGVRLIHRPLPGTGLIGISLAVDAGSRRESKGQEGIANLTAEMMMKGTAKRDGTKILWDLESLGAELSTSAEPDLVRFNLSCSKAAFGRAFEILADVIRNPSFPAAPFNIERGKVLMRLKAVADDMFENTWRLFNATLFKGHPYSVYPLGEAGTVDKLTTENLSKFHGEWYVPENMVLAIVGDITASDALSLTSTFFGTLHRGAISSVDDISQKVASAPENVHKIGIPAAPASFTTVFDVKAKKQAMVALGWIGPCIGHPDYAGMKVLNAVLGGGMSARYFMNIRNKAGLAYAVTGVFPSRIDGGGIAAIVGTDPKSAGRVKELVLAEIADIAANGVKKEELDRALSFTSGQYAIDHGTCLRSAQYLSWFESIGVGFAYDFAYPGELWKTTAEDVKRLANTYLKPDQAVLAITGPDGTVR